MGINKKILGVIGAGALISITYCGMVRPMSIMKSNIASYQNKIEAFNRVYHNALFEYADVDKDGFVTSKEKDVFFKDLLKDKNVNYVSEEMPRYKDGTQVSLEVMTAWILEYRPRPNSDKYDFYR